MPGRKAAVQPHKIQHHHTDHEANSLTEFIPLPGFYNAQPVTVTCNEYEKYLRISAEHCNKLLV